MKVKKWIYISSSCSCIPRMLRLFILLLGDNTYTHALLVTSSCINVHGWNLWQNIWRMFVLTLSILHCIVWHGWADHKITPTFNSNFNCQLKKRSMQQRYILRCASLFLLHEPRIIILHHHHHITSSCCRLVNCSKQ